MKTEPTTQPATEPATAEVEEKKRTTRRSWRRWLRRLSVVGAAGVLTFVSGAWEFAAKATDNFANRGVVNDLAKLSLSAAERGDYEAAEKRLKKAADIAPNARAVVQMAAVIDVLRIAEENYKAKQPVDTEAVVDELREIGLSADESNFCVAVCAAKAHDFERAERRFDAVSSDDARLAMLARGRTALNVLLPQTDSKFDTAVRQTALARAKQKIVEMRRYIPSEPWRIAPEYFRFQREMLRNIGLRHEKIAAELIHFAEINLTPKAPTPQQASVALAALNRAASVASSSDLTSSLNDQIEHYTSQVAEEDTTSEPNASDLETKRRKGVEYKRKGNWEEARKMFQQVVDAYKAGSPDRTLYRSYFSLALIAEYHDANPATAEALYDQAEKARLAAKVADAAVPNTYGYFCYKRARDTRDDGERKMYGEKARTLLRAALAIDPHYSKAANTLDGLETLLAKRSPSAS